MSKIPFTTKQAIRILNRIKRRYKTGMSWYMSYDHVMIILVIPINCNKTEQRKTFAINELLSIDSDDNDTLHKNFQKLWISHGRYE
jgi:hypothetical protein